MPVRELYRKIYHHLFETFFKKFQKDFDDNGWNFFKFRGKKSHEIPFLALPPNGGPNPSYFRPLGSSLPRR